MKFAPALSFAVVAATNVETMSAEINFLPL